MQINSASSYLYKSSSDAKSGTRTGSSDAVTSTSYSTTYSASSLGADTIQFKFPTNALSNFVAAANQNPEVRPDVVAHYKDLVSSPSYPPSNLLDGLSHVLAKALNPQNNLASNSETNVPK